MKTLFSALRLFLIMTFLTGVLYPLLVTGFAQLVFHEKANGSLVRKRHTIVGSALIGQSFDNQARYFSSRPSATGYDPIPSSGSNDGLTNRQLSVSFHQRDSIFRMVNMLDPATMIPSEMLFASASGLDPHISPEAAFLQVNRICQARKFSTLQRKQLEQLIEQLTEPPQFLCLGQRRINVFLLNLETDKIR